jgi:hypothetical protein
MRCDHLDLLSAVISGVQGLHLQDPGGQPPAMFVLRKNVMHTVDPEHKDLCVALLLMSHWLTVSTVAIQGCC